MLRNDWLGFESASCHCPGKTLSFGLGCMRRIHFGSLIRSLPDSSSQRCNCFKLQSVFLLLKFPSMNSFSSYSQPLHLHIDLELKNDAMKSWNIFGLCNWRQVSSDFRLMNFLAHFLQEHNQSYQSQCFCINLGCLRDLLWRGISLGNSVMKVFQFFNFFVKSFTFLHVLELIVLKHTVSKQSLAVMLFVYQHFSPHFFQPH